MGPLPTVCRLAFRRLLGCDEFVPAPELAPLRQHVAAASGRLIAAMSAIRLGDITTQVGGAQRAA